MASYTLDAPLLGVAANRIPSVRVQPSSEERVTDDKRGDDDDDASTREKGMYAPREGEESS